jgi:hypothetical protein
MTGAKSASLNRRLLWRGYRSLLVTPPFASLMGVRDDPIGAWLAAFPIVRVDVARSSCLGTTATNLRWLFVFCRRECPGTLARRLS